MTGFAGTLGERVTLLVRDAARDALGGAVDGWRDGPTVWASVRPDGIGPGDDAGGRPRWIVSLRTTYTSIVVERLRWGGRVLHVRRIESDPVTPDRHTLRTEELR